MVKTVNDKALKRYLDATERPLLIHFKQTGTSAGPNFATAAREIALSYKGQLDVVEISVDENPTLSAHIGVEQGPLLVFYEMGVEMARLNEHDAPQPFFEVIDRILNEV